MKEVLPPLFRAKISLCTRRFSTIKRFRRLRRAIQIQAAASFASIGTHRSVGIGSFRHLENLDERVSGWDPDQLYTGAVTTSKMVTAMQNSDLTWKAGENTADESGYCGHVAKLHTAFGSNF